MSLVFDHIREQGSVCYFDSTGARLTIETLPASDLDHFPKDVVILYLDNSLQSIGVFWRCYRSIHTVALLSPGLHVDLKKRLEELYKPLFIYDLSRQHLSGYERTDVFHRRKELVESEIDGRIKILLSTSGTTGSPKFVKLSEENVLQNALSIIDYLPIRVTDTTPLNLPLYYSYGLSVFTSNSLVGGRIFSTNSDVLSAAFWIEIQEHGFTSLSGVPYFYEMLSRVGFLKKNFPTLRYLTQAGGKLNEALLEKFSLYTQERQIPFFVMYGQTEATARMSFLSPEMLPKKIGSIGKPIKRGQFILDPDTAELLYKGPNVFGGYAGNRLDLSTYDQPDHLNTGDLARMDGEGYFYITGRSKRFMKIFGLRVNLDDVEIFLVRKLGLEFACLGIDDKYLLVAHTSQSDPELIRSALAALAIHASAIKTSRMEKFPLTPNGKIDYPAIKQHYSDTE